MRRSMGRRGKGAYLVIGLGGGGAGDEEEEDDDDEELGEE